MLLAQSALFPATLISEWTRQASAVCIDIPFPISQRLLGVERLLEVRGKCLHGLLLNPYL